MKRGSKLIYSTFSKFHLVQNSSPKTLTKFKRSRDDDCPWGIWSLVGPTNKVSPFRAETDYFINGPNSVTLNLAKILWAESFLLSLFTVLFTVDPIMYFDAVKIQEVTLPLVFCPSFLVYHKVISSFWLICGHILISYIWNYNDWIQLTYFLKNLRKLLLLGLSFKNIK